MLGTQSPALTLPASLFQPSTDGGGLCFCHPKILWLLHASHSKSLVKTPFSFLSSGTGSLTFTLWLTQSRTNEVISTSPYNILIFYTRFTLETWTLLDWGLLSLLNRKQRWRFKTITLLKIANLTSTYSTFVTGHWETHLRVYRLSDVNRSWATTGHLCATKALGQRGGGKDRSFSPTEGLAQSISSITLKATEASTAAHLCTPLPDEASPTAVDYSEHVDESGAWAGSLHAHSHDSEFAVEDDFATGLSWEGTEAADRFSCWTHWGRPVRLPSAVSVWIHQLRRVSCESKCFFSISGIYTQ